MVESLIKLLGRENKDSYTEDKLIKKSIKGDSECFEILMMRYTNYLYKIAYNYKNNKEDALDLIQECSYRGWMNIKTLNKDVSFKFWISRILINIAIDIHRKESKLNICENTDLNDIKKDDGLISIEEKVDLHKAIESLKPEYKAVILLKYFDDLTIQNISYIMNKPENTIKTYLKRAKESLKDTLKEDYLYEI